MTALRKQLMSVEDFLVWAERRPERWELLDGIAIAMSPERVVHGDVKYRVARALDSAIAKAKVPCRFVLDSAAVRIDARSLYQPDALVYCGDPVAPDALEIPTPVIVFPKSCRRRGADRAAGDHIGGGRIVADPISRLSA